MWGFGAHCGKVNAVTRLSFAEQGRIKLLGVTSEERRPDLPDVPTFAEAGYDVAGGGATPEISVTPAREGRAIREKELFDAVEEGIFEGIEQGMSGGTTPAAPDQTMFAVAFWLAFSMHVAIGEWWLRRTPALNG